MSFIRCPTLDAELAGGDNRHASIVPALLPKHGMTDSFKTDN